MDTIAVEIHPGVCKFAAQVTAGLALHVDAQLSFSRPVQDEGRS